MKFFQPQPLLQAAEQDVNARADGQDVIGHEEILEIQDIAAQQLVASLHRLKPRTAGSDRMNRPMVPMRHIFLRDRLGNRSVKHEIMFSITPMTVDMAAKIINRKNSAPQSDRPHLLENARQGDEDERGARTRVYVKGKACRNNDQTGAQCDKGIECGNVDGLAEQRALAADIRAENRHGRPCRPTG